MLYMIGTLSLDTRPFNADAMARTATADLAEKPVVGGFAPSEFMGEGKDEITLSGKLLPTKIGGLSQLEVADSMRKAGARVPVMRGDGKRFGTYAIVSVSEKHKDLTRDGVGFTVDYSLKLKKVQADRDGASAVISGLLSLFDAV